MVKIGIPISPSGGYARRPEERMPARQRSLTQTEVELVRAAFAERIDYRRVRLSDGPGINLAARIAFAKGNPAITLGSTIYFKRDFCADFCAPRANRKSFMHEMAHVWQYQRLGISRFLLRYGKEVAQVGGRPARMYRYTPGETRFADAMLEAQAEMVGDYSEALWAGQEPRKAALARNLAGSGVYGL
jgi:hypothetical protein